MCWRVNASPLSVLPFSWNRRSRPSNRRHTAVLPSRGRGGRLDLGLAVPAVARQTARQELHLELAVAAGDHLGAELLRADFALILALYGEVGTGGLGVDERSAVLRRPWRPRTRRRSVPNPKPRPRRPAAIASCCTSIEFSAGEQRFFVTGGILSRQRSEGQAAGSSYRSTTTV